MALITSGCCETQEGEQFAKENGLIFLETSVRFSAQRNAHKRNARHRETPVIPPYFPLAARPFLRRRAFLPLLRPRRPRTSKRPSSTRVSSWSWLTAAIPMENPYCSCKRVSSSTRVSSWSWLTAANPCGEPLLQLAGLLLQSLWRVPTAAVSC